jgi:hypothetical protein
MREPGQGFEDKRFRGTRLRGYEKRQFLGVEKASVHKSKYTYIKIVNDSYELNLRNSRMRGMKFRTGIGSQENAKYRRGEGIFDETFHPTSEREYLEAK